MEQDKKNWIHIESQLPKDNEICWIYWKDREVLLGCRKECAPEPASFYSFEDDKIRWAYWWMPIKKPEAPKND
jgi:hypothetical protein